MTTGTGAELEQRLVRARHDDGLLDLALGLWAIGLATDLGFQLGFVAPITALIAAMSYRRIRSRLTLPRLGRVVFRREVRERQRTAHQHYLWILSVCAALGIVIAVLANSGWIEPGRGVRRTLFGLVLAGLIAAGARRLEVPRFLGYGALLGGSVILGSLVESRTLMVASLTASGTLISIIGAVMISRFLVRHPPAGFPL